MSLARSELLQRLRFPKIWEEKGLYPDDLYQVQLEAFIAEARDHGIPPDDYSSAGGMEHYRYGAFRFWLFRNPGREVYEALMEAAVLDPDPPMVGAAIKDLISSYSPSPAILELVIQAVSRSRAYYLAEKELRALRQRPEDDD